MLEVEFEGELAHSAFRSAFCVHGRDWIERHRIDVVVSLDPLMADNLVELGFRVPEDVACASLDVLPPQVGEVAGVVQDYEVVSAAAVDLVHEQLINNERGQPLELYQTHFGPPRFNPCRCDNWRSFDAIDLRQGSWPEPQSSVIGGGSRQCKIAAGSDRKDDIGLPGRDA